MLAHPGALRRPDHRRADAAESIAAVGRRPASSSATYVAIFDRFAAMIAAGHVPVPGRRQPTPSAAPRVGDGVIVLDARRPRRATPRRTPCRRCTGSASTPTPIGMRLAELGFDDGVGARRPSSDAAPGHRGVRAAADITCCSPLHPAPRRAGEVTGGVLLLRDVTEVRRRDRLLLSQGRHDPRDPPPGEEQPADDLVAAAPAGPAAAVARRPRRRSRSRCGASARSRSCTRRCRARPATTSRSSRSCGRWSRMVEESAVSRRTARSVHGRRRRRQAAGARSRRRWRWCSPSCCRTPSTTRSRGPAATAASVGGARSRNDGDGELRSRSIDDGVGLPDGFTLEQATRARPVDRADARHHRARRHDRRCSPPSGRTGHVGSSSTAR